MNLIIQHYDEKNVERRNEYIYCIRKNLDNPYITNVVLFAEGTTAITDNKIKSIINIDHRLKYSEAFQYANAHLRNEICILANLDIYFDETLEILKEVDIKNTLVALTRYNVLQDKIEFHNMECSQDAWIFVPPTPNVHADFTLGCPGCDNRIAAEFDIAKWKLLNPCKSIKCYHLHNNQIRNYGNVVPGPHMSIPYSSIKFS